jgi:hypothetical protein
VERPGADFHVYNVHLAWQPSEHAQHVTLANAAVTNLESAFGDSR